jgi:hypothetical protein
MLMRGSQKVVTKSQQHSHSHANCFAHRTSKPLKNAATPRANQKSSPETTSGKPLWNPLGEPHPGGAALLTIHYMLRRTDSTELRRRHEAAQGGILESHSCCRRGKLHLSQAERTVCGDVGAGTAMQPGTCAHLHVHASHHLLPCMIRVDTTGDAAAAQLPNASKHCMESASSIWHQHTCIHPRLHLAMRDMLTHSSQRCQLC